MKEREKSADGRAVAEEEEEQSFRRKAGEVVDWQMKSSIMYRVSARSLVGD